MLSSTRHKSGAADLGVTWLDYGVNQIATPVIGKKGALHRVDGDLLKILQGQTKGIPSRLEFPGHGRVAHQAVVGVQRNAKFLLIKNLKGMLGKAAGGPGMNIADQANLQGNPFVKDVLREVAQFHRLTLRDGNVFDQSRPVSDAVRSAVLNGLPNRFLTEPFASMNRDVEILPLNIVKSIHVLFGRKPALLTSQIESHNPALAKVNGELGHFQGNIHIAHRADDQPGRNSKVLSAPLQACEHGGDNLLMAQSLASVKNWGEASLKIDHAVPAEVFGLFVSYSFERLLGLHHGDGVRKAFKIFWQASLVGSLAEPARQVFRIFGRELAVFCALRQLNYSFRSQHAVKVFV